MPDFGDWGPLYRNTEDIAEQFIFHGFFFLLAVKVCLRTNPELAGVRCSCGLCG